MVQKDMERIVNVMNIKEVKQLLRDVVNKPTLGIWKNYKAWDG